MNIRRILTGSGAGLIILAVSLLFIDRIRYYHDMTLSFVLNSVHQAAHTTYAAGRRVTPPVMEKFNEAADPSIMRCGPVMFFITKQDMKLTEVADRIIRYTNYYHSGALASTLGRINAVRNTVPAGTPLLVPRPVPAQFPSPTRNRYTGIPATRGLYLTGITAGSRDFPSKITEWSAAGINSVVFDLKDVTGAVNWKSDVPLCRRYDLDSRHPIDNPRMMIRELRSAGIYVIGRIAVFRDEALAKKAPGLAIRSRRTGKPWLAGRKEIWCDPTNRDVQDYNIALANEMADMGVDEVQFDYIRFPTGGETSDALYARHFGSKTRDETITEFLKKARAGLHRKGVFLSIDIFGVVAWGKEVDIRKTGQRIELLAPHCDVISPMLYPSHFNDDFDGYRKPGDEPYYFIATGCRKVMETAGVKVIVRPWLQAFAWRVSNYNSRYITEQVRGSNDSGAKGYLFWNAGNNYDRVMDAMPAIVQMEKAGSAVK